MIKVINYINMKRNIVITSNRGIPFLFVCLFILLFINLFHGFCWSDEAFYLSEVHYLYNGGGCFIDMWAPTQFYASIILPFYALYLKIFNSSDGIYLAARIFTFILQFATGIYIYRTLRTKVGNSISFASSAFFIIFCRGNIFGPSYYTLCMIFYILGILFSMNSKNSHIMLFISGICFGLSIITIPHLILVYVGYSFFALIYLIKKSINKTRDFFVVFSVWCGTIFVATIYIYYLLERASFSQYIENIHFVLSEPGYENQNLLKKILSYGKSIVKSYVFTMPLIILCAISLFLCHIKKRVLSTKLKRILFFINFAFFVFNLFSTLKHPFGIESIALFAFAIICVLLCECPALFFKNSLIKFFVIPGILFSFAFFCASDTRNSAIAIGFVIVAPFSFTAIVRCIEEFFSSVALRNSLKLIVFSVILLFALFQRFFLTYRDSNFLKTTEKLTQGPAKGLYTTMQHKEYYNDVFNLMESIEVKNPDDTIFISSMCPWAYLMFLGKYGSFQTWRTYFDDPRLQIFYEEKGHPLPKYVLDIDESYPIASRHPQVEEGWFYDILQTQYISKNVACGILYQRAF